MTALGSHRATFQKAQVKDLDKITMFDQVTFAVVIRARQKCSTKNGINFRGG